MNKKAIRLRRTALPTSRDRIFNRVSGELESYRRCPCHICHHEYLLFFGETWN